MHSKFEIYMVYLYSTCCVEHKQIIVKSVLYFDWCESTSKYFKVSLACFRDCSAVLCEASGQLKVVDPTIEGQLQPHPGPDSEDLK